MPRTVVWLRVPRACRTRTFTLRPGWFTHTRGYVVHARSHGSRLRCRLDPRGLCVPQLPAWLRVPVVRAVTARLRHLHAFVGLYALVALRTRAHTPLVCCHFTRLPAALPLRTRTGSATHARFFAAHTHCGLVALPFTLCGCLRLRYGLPRGLLHTATRLLLPLCRTLGSPLLHLYTRGSAVLPACGLTLPVVRCHATLPGSRVAVRLYGWLVPRARFPLHRWFAPTWFIRLYRALLRARSGSAVPRFAPTALIHCPVIQFCQFALVCGCCHLPLPSLHTRFLLLPRGSQLPSTVTFCCAHCYGISYWLPFWLRCRTFTTTTHYTYTTGFVRTHSWVLYCGSVRFARLFIPTRFTCLYRALRAIGLPRHFALHAHSWLPHGSHISVICTVWIAPAPRLLPGCAHYIYLRFTHMRGAARTARIVDALLRITARCIWFARGFSLPRTPFTLLLAAFCYTRACCLLPLVAARAVCGLGSRLPVGLTYVLPLLRLHFAGLLRFAVTRLRMPLPHRTVTRWLRVPVLRYTRFTHGFGFTHTGARLRLRSSFACPDLYWITRTRVCRTYATLPFYARWILPRSSFARSAHYGFYAFTRTAARCAHTYVVTFTPGSLLVCCGFGSLPHCVAHICILLLPRIFVRHTRTFGVSFSEFLVLTTLYACLSLYIVPPATRSSPHLSRSPLFSLISSLWNMGLWISLSAFLSFLSS